MLSTMTSVSTALTEMSREVTSIGSVSNESNNFTEIVRLLPQGNNLKDIVHIVNDILIPLVCVFGIVGNSVSLVVFNWRCMSDAVGVIEKSATAGLVTLAFSDLSFCLVGFPPLILGNISPQAAQGWFGIVPFYYNLYKVPMLNLFLFSSTWLIVLISTERCLAICYPFVARDIITVRRTSIVHLAVFLISLCLNLPLFYAYKIQRHLCTPTEYCYLKVPSWFFYQQTHTGAHFITWSILGTFLPLAMLMFGNFRIVRSIYSRRNASSSTADNQQVLTKTTWILVTMVFCFITCVCPSIFLQFFYRIGVTSNHYHYSITNLLANMLQAIKFSGNFLLYCLLHQKFRRAIRCDGQPPSGGYIATRVTTTDA